MNKQILVAVDGSVYSSSSLDYLIRLFRNDPEISIDLIGIIREGSGSARKAGRGRQCGTGPAVR